MGAKLIESNVSDLKLKGKKKWAAPKASKLDIRRTLLSAGSGSDGGPLGANRS